MQAVIGAERNEIRTEVVRLLDSGDIGLVECGIMRGGIGPGGNHPEHLIAHIVEIVIIGEVSRTDDFDAGFG